MRTVSTFSKHPNRYPDHYPKELSHAGGAYVWDNFGHRFIDFVQGLTSTGVLGHAHPGVVSAVRNVSELGTAFHLPNRLEQETAHLILSSLPYADSSWGVRFCLNGTDATQGAVRLARAVNDSKDILTFKDAYHGDSADWAIVNKHNARGITGENYTPTSAPFSRDIESNLRNFDISAVIFEIQESPTDEFVMALNSCKDHRLLLGRTLLIADEVVTGFRLAKGGACELYGIKPDLACFGKALGSGFAVAALVGKGDYMREFDLEYTNSPVFMSYTHAGNLVGLAAANATLKLLADGSILAAIAEKGKWFLGEFGGLIATHGLQNVIYIGCQPQRFVVNFKDVGKVSGYELSVLFQQRMAMQGILTGVAWCPTICHTTEILNKTLDACSVAMASVKRAVERETVEGELDGPVPPRLFQPREN